MSNANSVMECFLHHITELYRVFDNNGFQNMYSPYPSLIVTIYEVTYLQIENKFHHRFSKNIMKFNDGWQKAKEN